MESNVRRTKQVTSCRTIKDEARTFERAQAWTEAQDWVERAAALTHPKKG